MVGRIRFLFLAVALLGLTALTACGGTNGAPVGDRSTVGGDSAATADRKSQ